MTNCVSNDKLVETVYCLLHDGDDNNTANDDVDDVISDEARQSVGQNSAVAQHFEGKTCCVRLVSVCVCQSCCAF